MVANMAKHTGMTKPVKQLVVAQTRNRALDRVRGRVELRMRWPVQGQVWEQVQGQVRWEEQVWEQARRDIQR